MWNTFTAAMLFAAVMALWLVPQAAKATVVDVKRLAYANPGGCDGDQDDCCTESYPIGFCFPFFCSYYTLFTASTNGEIYFGECDDNAYNEPPGDVFILRADLFLHPAGHIGLNHTVVNGVPVAVIEWSHVTIFEDEGDDFGAMQIWLFQNGSIGFAYHFTETAMIFIAETLIDIGHCEDCGFVSLTQGIYDYGSGNFNSARADFLLASQAYILTPYAPPGDLQCSHIYDTSKWRPPNVCFNEDILSSQSESASESSRSHSLSESASESDRLQSESMSESMSESPSDSASESDRLQSESMSESSESTSESVRLQSVTPSISKSPSKSITTSNSVSTSVSYLTFLQYHRLLSLCPNPNATASWSASPSSSESESAVPSPSESQFQAVPHHGPSKAQGAAFGYSLVVGTLVLSAVFSFAALFLV